MTRAARRAAAGLGAVLLLAAAAPAGAAVSCSVSATAVAFGVYNPFSAAPANSNGTVTASCTLLSGPTTTVSLQVSLGTGGSGSFSPRRMTSGGQSLAYNLFWSTAYAQVWGDGTGGSFYGVATLTVSALNPTQQATGTMYGQIPAGQDVGPGSYADTIVITLTY